MVDVLLIDDDVCESKLLDCYLKMRFGDGYNFSHAADVENAEIVLQRKKFDAVFLDNRLGEHQNFTTTLPLIDGLLDDARLFVISASIDDPCLVEDIPNVERVIDKFDMKSEIGAGLLG